MKQSMRLFREIQTLEGLLIRSQDRSWSEIPRGTEGLRPYTGKAEASAQPRRTATVLYLGCNILRTPHLAQTAVALFRYLGEDFVALAGPAFCCGLPYEREAGIDGARPYGERLARRFGQFEPRQVVMWCPSCFYFYKHALALAGPFRLLHISEFLAENRDKFLFIPQPATRVALHYHCDSPDAERQAAAAQTLLRAIPGLELLEIGSTDTWGRNCTGALRERMGREAWEGLIIPYFEKAAAGRADIFALQHHGCYRVYAGYQGRFPFAIEHYLTVVARALGIAYSDKYQQYLLWKERARILADGAPCLEANGVTPERAAAAVDNVFVHDRGL